MGSLTAIAEAGFGSAGGVLGVITDAIWGLFCTAAGSVLGY